MSLENFNLKTIMAVYGDSGAMKHDGRDMEKAQQNFVLFNKPPFLFYNYNLSTLRKNKNKIKKPNPKALNFIVDFNVISCFVYNLYMRFHFFFLLN